MRVLFHIDYLIEIASAPQDDPLLSRCREKAVEGWVLPAYIPLLYQHLLQTMDDKGARASIRQVLSFLTLYPMTGMDIQEALISESTDFASSLTAGAAEAFNIDTVVTLNPQKFSKYEVKAVTPEEFLTLLTSGKPHLRRVPMLDMTASYHECLDHIEHEMFKVIRSSRFILGSTVQDLETKIANYCKADFAVGVSSGTDALLISLLALGIGEGDEVITTPFTFFATYGAIVRAGARPVFADIDSTTFNISFEKIEQAVTDKTKAILPVHLYGQCADMDPILELAKRKGIAVIEDAAQAIGAEYKNRKAGSLGDAGCFSFYPTKNLGGFGDAGMVTVSSAELYEKLKVLRVHGSQTRYIHDEVGGNFRLDALQAAILSARFDFLETWTEKRRTNADNYRRLFEQAGLTGLVKLPVESSGRHVYHQFVIRVWESKRNELKHFLEERGVSSEIYYPVPLHLQKCVMGSGYKMGDFPHAEKAAGETLALPISHEVTTDQLEYVVENIKNFFS